MQENPQNFLRIWHIFPNSWDTVVHMFSSLTVWGIQVINTPVSSGCLFFFFFLMLWSLHGVNIFPMDSYNPYSSLSVVSYCCACFNYISPSQGNIAIFVYVVWFFSSPVALKKLPSAMDMAKLSFRISFVYIVSLRIFLEIEGPGLFPENGLLSVKKTWN